MNKLNICIDIDGTITSPYHFIPYLNEMYNKSITEEEYTTHKWEELYNATIEDLLENFHSKYMYCYKEATLVDYAKDIIDELGEYHNLSFVTARSEVLTDITREWLHENGLGRLDVHLLGSDYKIEKAKELNCNIFIEDNPSNAMQLASEGMNVLLIDTNYNKDVNHENITRVINWREIKNFIDNYK